MRKKAQPYGEMQVPDYTLAFLESEGHTAKPGKVRSTKRIVLVLMLGVLAALLAAAGIWYWSVSGKSMGGWRDPGILPSQRSGHGCPSVSSVLAEPSGIRQNCKLFRNKAPSLLENSQNFVS